MSTAQALRVEDLNHVERELVRMRARESGSSVRATTLNLVAFAGTDEHLNRTVDALQLIGGSRPLRAIVMVPGEDTTSAAVSSTCWRNVSGQEVRSEQIVVTARPVAMPSAVVSLLIPDLPTFLLWNGDLGDRRELLLGLADEATRLILDSDECGLETVVEAGSLSVAVTDLAWARLTPWREALASLTDSRDGLQLLKRAMGVEVRGPSNEAALIAGWLRSRMGRQLGLQHEHARKALDCIRVDCGKDDLVVERTGQGDVGRAVCGGASEHAVLLPRLDWATLLGAQLDRLGSDQIFEQALSAAGD